MLAIACLISALAALAAGQQVGINKAEVHPALAVSYCTGKGNCLQKSQNIVLDANWRWLHNATGYTNCYTGTAWNADFCPDGISCAKTCALEGADYSGTYGITTSGTTLSLGYVTGQNVGSRVYLMDSPSTYQIFKLKNREFTFDIDVSNLPCGLNGALYFSQMSADGDMGGNNNAGAAYGTGYCDAQCPHDIKFINGVANIDGKTGTCCSEMDIWEGNSISNAFTTHVCTHAGLNTCTDPISCGDGANRYSGQCDKDGCDFNSYRLGNLDFFGPGKTVDTTKPMTVVTQFLTTDGTDSGDLKEIRRYYVQNGVTIGSPKSVYPSLPFDSITQDFCSATKTSFNNTDDQKGGLKAMGKALDRGMVLVMSLWDDTTDQMLWLDSLDPPTGSASTPGVARGSCPTDVGSASYVRNRYPNSKVSFSNIKFGEIGSTFGGPSTTITVTNTPPPLPTSTTSTTSSSTTTTSSGTTTTPTGGAGCSAHWGQCGGKGWSGPSCCEGPWKCVFSNDWYSQCL